MCFVNQLKPNIVKCEALCCAGYATTQSAGARQEANIVTVFSDSGATFGALDKVITKASAATLAAARTNELCTQGSKAAIDFSGSGNG